MKRLIYTGTTGLELVNFLEDAIEGIKEKKPKKLEFLLNSGGGDTQYNSIIQRQVKQIESMVDVTVININCCYSSAFDFYMCFSKRAAELGATFMIHAENYSFRNEPAEFIMDYLGEAVEAHQHVMDNLLKFFKKNGMTAAEARQIRKKIDMGGDYYFNKDTAIRYGVVNAFI